MNFNAGLKGLQRSREIVLKVTKRNKKDTYLTSRANDSAVRETWALLEEAVGKGGKARCLQERCEKMLREYVEDQGDFANQGS